MRFTVRRYLAIGGCVLIGLASAPVRAQAPKWVIVRSSCPTAQGAVAGPAQWTIMHSKCWSISQTAGQCAVGLRGNFASQVECVRSNSGVNVQTQTAGGLHDQLRCVPRTPTAEICGVSISGTHYATREACLAANGGGAALEVSTAAGTDKHRCEMSLD